MTTEVGRAATSSGQHDRATWAGLLCAILRESRTGILTVRCGRSWKRFEIVLGIPVNYDTDREDDPIGTSLSACAPDARAEHLRDAVAASLEWATGDWSFESSPSLPAESIDPALLPDPVTLTGLWAGAKDHLAMDEAMSVVSGMNRFARAADFEDWFPLLDVEPPFEELPAALADGCVMGVLYRRLPDRSGNLVKLLWLLHCAALFEGQLGQRLDLDALLEGLHEDHSREGLERVIEAPDSMAGDEATSAGGPFPTETEEPAKAPAPALSAPQPKRTPLDPEQVIRRDYKLRMGTDYYTFLSLNPDASQALIERRARQLAGRWQAAQRSRVLSGELKDLATELGRGVQLVYRTLADPTRRGEYDRRQAAGQAPVLRPIKGGTGLSTPASPRPQRPKPVSPEVAPIGGGPGLQERVRHFVEAGQWKVAAGLLKEARLLNPSDPDVLAELGWVTWKLDKDHESAEEFLQLAVTFDRGHLVGLSYLGKLALEVGDDGEARKWLERVMELDKSQRWARRALRKLPRPQPEGGKQPGFKFWRKGD